MGSTTLSSQLDPEDMLEVLRAYQERCASVASRYDGYIAQYLGDGVLFYFGYPHAQEDAARRAVLAGLALLESMRELSGEASQAGSASLQLRIGIHTGSVVLGEIGGGTKRELLAIGETPNLASRIQATARPGSVVISDATRRLVAGYFHLAEIAAAKLKGFEQPIPLFEVAGESGARSRLEGSAPSGLSAFVDRDRETAIVLEAWKDVLAGSGRALVLTGEAGIGKSRLIRTVQERLSTSRDASFECYCSPLFRNTALYPVLDMLSRVVGIDRRQTPTERVALLERALVSADMDVAAYVPLLAPLLSIPLDRTQVRRPNLSPQRERQLVFEALCTWVRATAQRKPSMLIVEDLHWADASTLELLGLLLSRELPGGLLMLLTHRSEFHLSWATAKPAQMTLERLESQHARKIIDGIARSCDVPDLVSAEVIEKADGVPLFLEEITRAVVESGALQTTSTQFDKKPVPFAIPATVQDSLAARLDRLGADRSLLQLAAMLGRTFQFELLHALMNGMPALSLRAQLDRFVRSELLFRVGAPLNETYGFKHALIQDAAYESLLKSTRQHYHRQIAHTLATQFPELAAAQPELLARHYAGGMLPQAASDAWRSAGEHALARSAYAEAIQAYRKSIEQLTAMPASKARDVREVELRITLGLALISTRGFAAQEVAENYQRAHDLAEQAGNVPSGVLYGIWSVRLLTADVEATARLLRQFEQNARVTQLLEEKQLYYGAQGILAFFAGQYAVAGEAFRRAVETTDYANAEAVLNQLHAQGYEGLFYALLYAAWNDTLSGEFESAERTSAEVIRLAEALDHPYTIAMVLSFVGAQAYDLEDAASIRRLCKRQRDLAAENGFAFWLATANALLGWADVRDGKFVEGLAQIDQALAMLKMLGCVLVYPYYLSCAVDAYVLSGRTAEALSAVDEALDLTQGRVAVNYRPMLYKLKADVLASLADRTGAEALYVDALATTRAQGAKLYELRIAIAYARLLIAQSRDREARELLARSTELPGLDRCSEVDDAVRLLRSLARSA